MPKCWNLEMASKLKTHKDQTGLSQYIISMFLKNLNKIPTFSFFFFLFFFPQGIWLFQNSNSEMSESFNQTNLQSLAFSANISHYK